MNKIFKLISFLGHVALTVSIIIIMYVLVQVVLDSEYITEEKKDIAFYVLYIGVGMASYKVSDIVLKGHYKTFGK